MIDRSHVWTGSLNDRALGPPANRHVGLYDTTLRDGEQTVGVVLTPEEKLEIAKGLAAAGIDRIEAGFPRVSDEDWRAVELMSAAGIDAELWGFSRAVKADVEALVELGLSASVIESPISDLKLDAIGVSRESMLERIGNAVGYAVENGITVAFFGVDGSRSEPDFFRAAYRRARDAGAAEIVVVDTLGIASPEAAAQLVEQALDAVGGDVPVHWHGHDDFGLATAAAVAAVRAGASWVHGTVNGMGERGGNADVSECALALEALYGYTTNLRFDEVRSLSAQVREMSGYALEPWKPLVGENLFTRESGAVAAQFHDPPSIEPYSSLVVGARRGLVLGKKSGIDSVRIRARELGLDVDESVEGAVLAAVKDLGVRKGGLVSDEEFKELVGAVSSGA